MQKCCFPLVPLIFKDALYFEVKIAGVSKLLQLIFCKKSAIFYYIPSPLLNKNL